MTGQASISSLFNSVSAATSTRGGPIANTAHAAGSSIQAAIVTTTPAGSCTLTYRPSARSWICRIRTFRPK
jgi:hypothetical protein